jgi:hypothetical protein
MENKECGLQSALLVCIPDIPLLLSSDTVSQIAAERLTKFATRINLV